jgi:CDP-diacylglycerol--glycerol-3-phosphate 3-phosphatidyltransferase
MPPSLPQPPARRDLAREFLYLPNILTLARIVLVPAVLVFVDNYSPSRSFVACLIYLAVSVTDFLDGFLARRFGQVSMLGKFLDPLADKLVVMAALVFLVESERISAWIAVVLLARELAINGLRAIASSEGLVIAASQGGKYKTALQLVGILFLLVHFKHRLLLTNVVIDFHEVGLWTLYISLGLSVWSALEYFRDFGVAVMRKSRALADDNA